MTVPLLTRVDEGSEIAGNALPRDARWEPPRGPLPAHAPELERLREGDWEAFRVIFEAHYPRLIRLARSLLRDSTDAEDIVQDVFLRIWRDRGRLVIQKSLRTYLLAAVRNRVLDHLRGRTVERRWVDPMPETGEPQGIRHQGSGGGSDPATLAELEEAYRRAIAALPERCRTTFLLCRGEGLSYADTADVMGVSLGTVRTQMGRALGALRVSLEPFLTLLLVLTPLAG